MDSNELDQMIDDLESIIPSPPNPVMFSPRNDWRPVWNLTKEIQEAFKQGVRYPTAALRQAAYERFQSLRKEASGRADDEKAHLLAYSEHHLGNVMRMCSGIGYSFFSDVVFMDKTTVDDMKARGRYLSEARAYVRDYSEQMLHEHKRECYAKFDEIQAEHQAFWDEYGKQKQAKTEGNLEKNREKYQKASEALEHYRNKASDLRDKIDDGGSEKWMGIWAEKLEEAEEKITSIEEQLSRLQEWIEEDERRLGGI